MQSRLKRWASPFFKVRNAIPNTATPQINKAEANIGYRSSPQTKRWRLWLDVMRFEKFFKVLRAEIGEHKVVPCEGRSESLSGNALELFECGAVPADVGQLVLITMILQIVSRHPA